MAGIVQLKQPEALKCPSCGGHLTSRIATGPKGWLKYTCLGCGGSFLEPPAQVEARLGQKGQKGWEQKTERPLTPAPKPPPQASRPSTSSAASKPASVPASMPSKAASGDW